MRTKNDNKERPWKPFRGLRPISTVHRSVASLATLAAAIFFVPSAAWAGGVVTNCTEADLRAAMAGGGMVTFACDGTITLASTITNVSNTTLDGSGRQVKCLRDTYCYDQLVDRIIGDPIKIF